MGRLRIRLSRWGTANNPYYQIYVSDSRKRRDAEVCAICRLQVEFQCFVSCGGCSCSRWKGWVGTIRCLIGMVEDKCVSKQSESSTGYRCSLPLTLVFIRTVRSL